MRRLVLALVLAGACSGERAARPPAWESRRAGGGPPAAGARTVRAPRGTPPVADATVAPAPTARQSLECPIDPGRADCRALCAAHATHEWCR